VSLLFALFLVVHGGIHVGYACSQSWPFVPGDPWLVTGLGADPGTVHAVGVALVVVTFIAWLLAALSATGVGSRLWAPLVVVAAVTSAILLTVFITPWTLPGLAIDAALLWAVVGRSWRPAPVLGRRQHA
jgi:hypothetical protein